MNAWTCAQVRIARTRTYCCTHYSGCNLLLLLVVVVVFTTLLAFLQNIWNNFQAQFSINRRTMQTFSLSRWNKTKYKKKRNSWKRHSSSTNNSQSKSQTAVIPWRFRYVTTAVAKWTQFNLVFCENLFRWIVSDTPNRVSDCVCAYVVVTNLWLCSKLWFSWWIKTKVPWAYSSLFSFFPRL